MCKMLYSCPGNFYPRSPCGERPDVVSVQYRGQNFYPRSPCGERPRVCRVWSRRRYFYPRSPCGERLEEVEKLSRVTVISIHALLAESDCRDGKAHVGNSLFLSTLSLRRATESTVDEVPTNEISIHALLAESDLTAFFRSLEGHNFYPRSPCGERHTDNNSGRGNTIFLSTLSLRRATAHQQR